MSEQHNAASLREPTITQDIGNFFRVLFAFIGGLWKQDMTDFELLSSVYFPPQPESEKKEIPPAEQDERSPEETGQPGTEESETQAPVPGQEPPAVSPPSETKTGQEKTEPQRAPQKPVKPAPRTQEREKTEQPATKPRKKTPQEEAVDLMREIASDPNHPYRKLSYKDLLEILTKGAKRPENFNDIINTILPFEGNDKVNEHEPNGGISKYGINSKYYPVKNSDKLTPEELKRAQEEAVRGLTKEKAIEFYRTEYWNKMRWPGGDINKMSAAVKLVAFDAAVNSGVEFGNGLLKKAGSDVAKMPQKMIDMRRAHYADLISREPEKYGQFKDGWENRLKTLESMIKRPDMLTATASMTAFLPVDPRQHRVSDIYHVRHNHPVHGGESLHRGTDYAMSENTLLPATSAGQVVSAREHNGYGQTLIISHGNGIFEMYAHLNHVLVKEGDIVKRGQGIARSGSTGEGTGPHLHHELWLQKGNDFYAIDELKAVNKNLLDPNVREMLIKNAAAKVSDINFIKPTIKGDIPAEFRDEGLKLTERTHTDEPLVASSAGTKPTDLTIR
ncbi:MAG: peptidoglycan DD-metalloendopeptidase family protein [Alphaproteobacteria bacterium]